MLRSVIAPLRASSRAICARAGGSSATSAGSRALHASSTRLRKHREAAEEIDEYDEPESSDDLFDLSSTPAPTSDRADLRAAVLSRITEIASLPPLERKRAIAEVRVGELRRVVSLTTPEELDGLREVFRTWRVLGMRVTNKTADETVGRCCNLGRPDLALELSEDRLQYGLPPLSPGAQTKLHHSLLSSTSTALPTLSPEQKVSPTLALLRLALLQRSGASAEDIAAGSLLQRLRRPAREASAAPEWRESAMGLLEQAGGVWAEEGRKVQSQQDGGA
ncbi:hypothetical protein JCM24511_05674 [Saitozyma sp. JCM 24511]|nr:hypothetical protein JCM24511_05674 [Saitozyma sp. JCM 24511]